MVMGQYSLFIAVARAEVEPCDTCNGPSTLQSTAVPYHSQAGQWLRAREFVVAEYLGNRASFWA